MDSDLGAMLQSVLSDPAQMEKIAQAAKGLMGSMSQPAQEPEAAAVPNADAVGQTAMGPVLGAESAADSDSRMVSSLGKLFSGKGDNSRSTALLMAMRPYMRPEKQEKLDRAVKIAQMVHIAGAVMQAYGGGNRGL